MRKNKIWITCCLFLISFSQINRAQEADSDEFRNLIYYISVELATTNPERGLYLADSLFIYSTDPIRKMEALKLSADINASISRPIESMDYALKAMELAKKEKAYKAQAFIYGYLSNLSRNIGFYSQGKAYLRKGEELLNFIDDEPYNNNFLANMNHELAEYAYIEGNYQAGIDYIRKSILLFSKQEDDNSKYYSIAKLEQLMGRTYYEMGDYEKALDHFILAKNYSEESGSANTIEASFIYQGIGISYLEAKELDSVGKYLHKAYKISENSSNEFVKNEVYKALIVYYEEINEPDSVAYFESLHQGAVLDELEKNRDHVGKAYDKLASLNENQTSQKEKKSNLVWYIAILIIGGGAISYFLLKRRKNNDVVVDTAKNKETEKRTVPKTSEPKISSKTKRAIEEKLNQFEKENEFIDNDMTFSTLVSYVGTNSKYLHLYLKNHLNTDYSSYINDLRIQYIIEKLKEDPEYRKYKIGYLAELCGFQSHSNFSVNFKRFTGTSPGEYISNIDNN